MNADIKIRTIYRIEGGILNGTEIEPFMFTFLVRYPHRKTPDCYIPPMKTKDKEVKTWHCCQEPCSNPDFEGTMDALIEHVMLHKGRLLKPWAKKQQLQTPIPAIRIPPNDWETNTEKHPCATNDDRRFVVNLYIENLKRWLHKQGLQIIEEVKA